MYSPWVTISGDTVQKSMPALGTESLGVSHKVMAGMTHADLWF